MKDFRKSSANVCDIFLDPHCPKNNLTLRIKTSPVMVGADATVYVWFLC